MVALNPGYHRELHRAAGALADRLTDVPDPQVVDLACGSGASTAALARALPEAELLGLDASSGMLAAAGAKQWPARVRFEQAVAGELDLERLGRGSRDGVLTCYLFRNVPEPLRDVAVAEVFALLRPGGWLVVQEYSVAGNRGARRVWDAVSHAVIIPLGALLDRNPGLYRYLWRSVLDFDSVARFADRLVAAGFTDVSHRTATGWQRGILHTFVARKPEPQP
ncbi:methyltransferase domain-containing protein [Tessaracoccus rhinocerotis]|uniref:Methyltransferase domain-containing protein n=2 Tax=Tessaracoccus rhinocerotis TaxID=1689449 RepID=A0A553K100_9ACTN|nr:methyltransferase domain-containing protein [Tessaracoccus rhinocerotis]